MKWMHSRKGLIEGELIKHDDGSDWAHIRLVGDQTIRGARGPQDWFDGDVLVARRPFLTEVTEDAGTE